MYGIRMIPATMFNLEQLRVLKRRGAELPGTASQEHVPTPNVQLPIIPLLASIYFIHDSVLEGTWTTTRNPGILIALQEQLHLEPQQSA